MFKWAWRSIGLSASLSTKMKSDGLSVLRFEGLDGLSQCSKGSVKKKCKKANRKKKRKDNQPWHASLQLECIIFDPIRKFHFTE
jgi:hypothetical protein